MNLQEVEKKFAEIGATANSVVRVPRIWRTFSSVNSRGVSETDPNFTVNIVNRDKTETFVLTQASTVSMDYQIPHVDKSGRHLVLVARELNEHGHPVKKSHFLCGHDERHWFVAAVKAVTTVNEAKDALKPVGILERQVGKNAKKRNKRSNDTYIRQGEWFFVPESVSVDPLLIRKHEPIMRSGRRGGKPHTAELAYRTGGRDVWVSGGKVIDKEAFEALPPKKASNYRPMKADPVLYVSGKVTHDDHATIELQGWHRVYQNTELVSRNVLFLD